MRILISLFALNCIFGFVPIILCYFLSKHIALIVILAVAILIWLKKELCEE